MPKVNYNIKSAYLYLRCPVKSFDLRLSDISKWHWNSENISMVLQFLRSLERYELISLGMMITVKSFLKIYLLSEEISFLDLTQIVNEKFWNERSETKRNAITNRMTESRGLIKNQNG